MVVRRDSQLRLPPASSVVARPPVAPAEASWRVAGVISSLKMGLASVTTTLALSSQAPGARALVVPGA